MKKRSRIISLFIIVFFLLTIMGGTTNNIIKNINLGLDLQGGFEILYEVVPAQKGENVTKKSVIDTHKALEERINILGVSEPKIQIEDGNRIRVQLAGVKNQDEARDTLSTQANLTFRDVNDTVQLDGSDLVSGKAQQSFNKNNQPIVSLKLKNKEKFFQLTKDILDMAPENKLVIWLDFNEGYDSYLKESKKEKPKYLSAPSVNNPINSDEVIIEGDFTLEEAQHLASLLNAGSLPMKLDEIYSTSVGAQFGQHSLNQTVLAGLIGISIVFLFMIFYYRFPGLIATLTLSFYIYLVLLIFDLMNGVLTLPGIAALILGVGMVVDANIITYERIKEEIRIGNSIPSAFKAGSKSSFLTILDANVTTILAATVLFIFGTSSVKGFATMLIVSILTSFITAVWGSRILLGLCVEMSFFKNNPGLFGVNRNSILENKDTLDLPTSFDKFDFVKHKKKFFALSGALISTGIILLVIFKLNLGIDFVNGTRVEIHSNKHLDSELVQKNLKEINLPAESIVISGKNQNIGVVRYSKDLNKNQINKLKNYIQNTYSIEPNISTVSPIIGKELAKNALLAIAFASIGIIIYVTIRFEWRMAVSAIIALLHDAFFMVVFFSFTRLEVDLTFIAAVLTIVGYSINDTIVTFDRLRENLQKKIVLKNYEDINEVVNKSLRQTIGRSINTVLTVIFTVVALLIFGSESIQNFSIALLIGLITGTYSSIFIASQLWLVLKKKELKKKTTIKTIKEKKSWSDEPQV
ncbi:protein translocase subunit SecDF [Rossellomorea arthrocnemi]|uniref:protein translocase subunit SecDF n=1 Tax=Rossellomorea arthrocnemi TaxID=2769542 RepID=UPI001917EA26|nr:protein translocase subunit SecDF [Rossellomorea arthrocnemi]